MALVTAGAPPRAPMFDDPSHRYAPDRVIVANHDRAGRKDPAGWQAPVLRAIAYPPGRHPGSAIRPECTAVQLITAKGDRWYGCDRAYINSELRMVLVGHSSRDEVRQAWEVVPEDCRS